MILFIFLSLGLTGCTTQDTQPESNDPIEYSLTGSVESNETMITSFLEGDGEISGPQCWIKVISPDLNEYTLDQPAPNMLIPLFYIKDNSSVETQLRVKWSDLDNNQKINDGDELLLTTLSNEGLKTGEWILKIISKTDGKIIYFSDPITIK